jgi:hypothetical protein
VSAKNTENGTAEPVEIVEKDIANNDAFSGAAGYSIPRKINVTYTVVFDTEEQQKDYYHYIRLLKKKYPDVRTIGGRIHKHIMDECIEGFEKQYGKSKARNKAPVGHEVYEDVKITKGE